MWLLQKSFLIYSSVMKKFYLLGSPLNHSLSPFIHTTLYKHFGIEASYQLKPVSLEKLKNFIRKKDFDGINVTSPYKQDVISLVDKITPEAQECGSVNTLYFENRKLVGDNTDGLGFCNVLCKKNISLKNKAVLIIGAGATAQTILQKVKKEKARSILVANRTLEKAEKINPSAFCSLSEVSYFLPQIDILINTVSAFDSRFQRQPFPLVGAETGCQNSWILDLTYNKCEREASLNDFLVSQKSLSDFENLGAISHTNYINGQEFLLAQALLSFKRWFPEINTDQFSYQEFFTSFS